MSLYLSSGLRKNHTRLALRGAGRADGAEAPVSRFLDRPALWNGLRISEATRQAACDRLDAPVSRPFRLVLLMLAKDALYNDMGALGTNGMGAPGEAQR